MPAGAQKGNKFAVGSPGPPPKISLNEIEVWAKKLDDWSKTDGAISLGHFVTDFLFQPSRFETFKERSEVFADVLLIAKQRIANRRLALVNEGKFYTGEYNKHQHHYDTFNKANIRDDLEFEASLKEKYKSSQDKYYDSVLDNLPDTSTLKKDK